MTATFDVGKLETLRCGTASEICRYL